MEKISICQVCGSIITRSIPRCPNCGEQTKVQVLYEWTPNDELEMAGDLNLDPIEEYDDPEDVLDLLFDAYEQVEYAYKDRDHYKDECKAAEAMIDKQIGKAKKLEEDIKELKDKISDLETVSDQEPVVGESKKKGLFK